MPWSALGRSATGGVFNLLVENYLRAPKCKNSMKYIGTKKIVNYKEHYLQSNKKAHYKVQKI